MSNPCRSIISFAVLILPASFFPAIGAQEKQPQERVGATAPGRKDEIAKQQFSLVEQLARVEASLDATNSLINNLPAADSPTVGSKPTTTVNSEQVLKWPQFYELVAERFHDRRNDRGQFFFTKAVLREVNPGDGRDSKETSNGIESPPADRPQTDEIDKVYREALDRATTELTKLSRDELEARRQKWEAEQAALWCQIAFREISIREFENKPLYRFQPYVASIGLVNVQRTKAMTTAVVFLRNAVDLAADAQGDPAKLLEPLRTGIGRKLCADLSDGWAKSIPAGDRQNDRAFNGQAAGNCQAAGSRGNRLRG